MFSALCNRLPSPSALMEYIPSKETLSGYIPSWETVGKAPTYVKDGFYSTVETVQAKAAKAGESLPCPEIVTRWAEKATTMGTGARAFITGQWERLGAGEWVTKVLQFFKKA